MRCCATHRMAEIAVSLGLLFLVALIVILWSGSMTAPVLDRSSSSSSSNSGRTASNVSDLLQQQNFARDLLQMNERAGNEIPQDDATSEDHRRRASPDETEDQAWGHWKGDIMPSGGGDSEYIVLAKANQNSYEDPLDEHSKAERHHSGHFRHSQNRVWDPHPQYEFTAFGRRFHLSLREDSSFAPPGVTVTRIGQNTSVHEYADHHLGCFYSGHVEGDPKSVVAVSLCHGMTGHLRTSTGNYLIKPTERWSSDSEKSQMGSPLRHLIYRLSKRDFGSFAMDTNRTANDLPDDNTVRANQTHECGVIDNEGSSKEESGMALYIDDVGGDGGEEMEARGRRRRRHVAYRDSSYDEDGGRSFALEGDQDSDLDIYGSWRTRRALPREYFIEIMVVADAKMIEYHGASLTSYILVLMNTVSRIYKDPSIGNPISLAVIKIKQVDQIFGVKHRGSDGIEAAEMLRKFCVWQKLNNPYEPSSEHHDTALLLTRENLCHNPGQQRCDTLGLAELGRMCSGGSSCAIVQDNGLATAFTIAHEIGHVLNMPHDDDPKCEKFRDHGNIHNIMSRMLDDNTVPWEWSKCSRHYVTEFLDAGLGSCLLDEPSDSKIRIKMSHTQSVRLPGEDYSENKQCELVFGEGSEICPHMMGDVCKRLWCTIPHWDNRSEPCHTQHMPWADGTVCGPGKWCHRGECVSRENLQPVDGQWGEWQDYGECSRTCGGGIKRKHRECDSPAPKNGGNYCVGERVRYRSCGTRECPRGSTDFRQVQCEAFNKDNLGIRNLGKNVRWHAKYTRIRPEDRCKLYCQVDSNQYYSPRDKVADGTPCGPDTFDICVNGHCKPAGCDHMLNSTAALDTCGVCRGDNSTCQRITGAYNASQYGYTRITKIPAGSSYIDIRQYGWRGIHNDSNYLALRLEEGGNYILNGNFLVMHRKVIIQPGVTIEYSGPEQVVERLNSSRPIGVDLILEVLSVGSIDPPQVTYEYTVPKKILNSFNWSLGDWTSCDRMCQGKKYRLAVCRGAVSNDYCFDQKPREHSEHCNIHCKLEWQEIPDSKLECLNFCGPVTLPVKHRCVQMFRDGSSRLLHDNFCSHLKRPPDYRSCTGPCAPAHWQYSQWEPCTVTCGDKGFKYRTARCVDAQNQTVPEDKCPADGKIVRQRCGHKSCPEWGYGEWTHCSAACGMGKRERPHWCQIDNRVVDREQCSGLTALVSERCDAGACPTWQSGEWDKCSTTCGDGIRTRSVVCQYTNGTRSDRCDSSYRPINLTSCSLEPCPTKVSRPPSVVQYAKMPFGYLAQHENDVDSHRITFRSGYTWNIEGYENCSKPCGGGIGKQIIRCISVETGKIAPNPDYCDINKRPPDTIACNDNQCPNWIPGDWSQCDVKCGEGYQHRQVLCQDSRGEIRSDSDCSELTRPRHVRKCKKSPSCSVYNSRRRNWAAEVPSYKWRTGAWGECSASCGYGVRRREVTCHEVNSLGWQDPTPSRGCSPNDKPSSEQFCNVRGCEDQFYWVAGNWRKCSQPCGRKGRQMRRLFCLDRQGRKVRRSHCPAKLRPQRKRKCNQRPCTGPTSCLEVQSRLKTNNDGEYMLLVGGRYMSIYCHGMESYEPQEYLTLPTGERENYAEIYDKRLQDPHTCPFEGRRNDTCECIKEPVTISGRTMFRRVRINVHTLYIIGDDYKFSMKMGMNNIEYGKAGDCYSKMNCPQGRFGINLSGTVLMLSPDVHWPKQNNANVVISKINNQRVIGKCGGYCGFCAPSPGLKLKVLPP